MSLDRPLPGIVLMLGFCAVAPLSDAFSKLASASLPLGQIVLARFAVQAVVTLPLVWMLGQTIRVPRNLFGLIAARTGLLIAGTWLMILSLRYLPLADAIAIAYVMPFILLILGHFLLGEEVGRRRIAACAVGFGGTLMVMQPSFVQVGWAAALPLAVAVVFSLYILVTRAVSKGIAPVPLQAVNGLLGTALVGPVILLANGSGWVELDPVSATANEWALIVAFGLLATLAHLFITWSLRLAPAATVAPVQYAEIPFAALWGWLVFSEFPNGLALAGVCVVAGSGLYVIWRERQNLPRPARPLPPEAPI